MCKEGARWATPRFFLRQLSRQVDHYLSEARQESAGHRMSLDLTTYRSMCKLKGKLSRQLDTESRLRGMSSWFSKL